MPLALAAALLVLVQNTLAAPHAAPRLGSLPPVTSASDGSRDSYGPSLSGDGTVVAFTSDSDLLNEGRLDDMNEIWLWKECRVYLPLVLRQ